MLVRVRTVRYPGRPWLTVVSMLGSMLFYSGLISGVMGVRFALEHEHRTWVPVSLLSIGAAGFGMMMLAKWLANRNGPRVVGTIDPAEMAKVEALLAQANAAKKTESEAGE